MSEITPHQNTKTIQLFIADDHIELMEALKLRLSIESDIEVVGTAHDGIEAVDRILALRPDITLLDYAMPNMNGLEALIKIKNKWPAAKIVLFTANNDQVLIDASKYEGAAGFIIKNIGIDNILRAVRQVHQGDDFIVMEDCDNLWT